MDRLPAVQPSPEDETFRREMSGHCTRALARLSVMERKVVLQAVVLDFKVAPLARRLGYSRGYLFSLRQSAFLKMRRDLDGMRWAA